MNVETGVGAREESIVSYCVLVGSDRQCLAWLRSHSSGGGPEPEVEETEKHYPMPLVCPLAEPAKCAALTIIMQPLQTVFTLCKPGWSLRKEYFELEALECTFLLVRSNLPATAVSLIDLPPPTSPRLAAVSRCCWGLCNSNECFLFRSDHPNMEECSEPNARLLDTYSYSHKPG